MKVGMIGCGFIGSMLAKECDGLEEIEEVHLFDIVSSRSRELAARIGKATVHDECEELIEASDIVIEAASHEAVERYGPKALARGKDLMILSMGAFRDNELFDNMRRLTKENGCHLYLPSGAIAGIDGLKSARVAHIDTVELRTTKSVNSLEGSDYIHNLGIDLKKLKDPTVVFEGTARDAVRLFPQNVNVAALISVSGVGFDRTRVTVIADPKATRNHHTLTVSGRFGSFRVDLKNFPSISNPKTSYLAGLSALATLRNIVSGVWIGT